MEVILQHEIDTLGRIGDIVKVKPGYARNYLIPRGLAVEADRRNRAEVEHRRRSIEAKRTRYEEECKARANEIQGLEVTITAKAGEGDRLFGSVTSQAIQKALSEIGVEVDRRKILLDGPIKSIGEHLVPVNVGSDVRAEVKVHVVREVDLEAEAAAAAAAAAEAKTAEEAASASSEAASDED